MTFVATLEPPTLWGHFDRILTIPRGSKEEDRIRRYVIDLAQRRGLAYATDAAGNLVVRKPAAPGREAVPVTVLQGHFDMVNEKNSDVTHDFATDPIAPRRAGDYLTATGTTLGSDNGIGVAAMLAVMEADDVAHGPLEFLFTVDEETGLTGAGHLSGQLLRGRRLINLDSEEEGALFVGCAGGADSTLRLPLGTGAPARGTRAMALRLRGLKGGHSGIDIHLGRGNAVQLLARALHAALLDVPFRLARFEGGNKHNAIPREASATVVAEGAEVGVLRAALEREVGAIREEYRAVEPDLVFQAVDTDAPAASWDDATTRTVLRLLTALPHGVLAMSHAIPGLVETSTNLATASQRNGTLTVLLSSRSSVDTALLALRRRIRATAELAGATVEEREGYPGWKPDLDSPLLDAVKRVHRRVLGADPEIKAIHAGLECGIIGEKVPGMDMISFGPQIEFPHSPDERVKIDSVERFYRLLVATLEELR